MTRMLFYQVTVNEPDVSVSTLTGLNVGVEKDRIIAVELKGNGPIPSYFERLDVKPWEIKPCLGSQGLVFSPSGYDAPSEIIVGDLRSRRYVMKDDGTLFERLPDKPLEAREALLFSHYSPYRQVKECDDRKKRVYQDLIDASIDGIKRECNVSGLDEYESELQRTLDANYTRVEPLSPFDPRITTEYELGRRRFSSGELSGGGKGGAEEISRLFSDRSKEVGEIDLVGGYFPLDAFIGERGGFYRNDPFVIDG